MPDVLFVISGQRTGFFFGSTNVQGERMMKRFFVVAMLLATTAVAQAQTYREIWDDIRKPWRPNSEMDAELDADVQVCDRQIGEQLWGRVSPAYRRCMARHHWKLNHVERLHPSQQSPDDSSSPPADIEIPSSPSPPPIDMTPPPQVDPGPSPDIHPFCPNTIC